MSRWLYQMSEESWPSKNYRHDVRESVEIRWPTRRKMFADELPAPGDIIICLYVPTGCDKPGVCGFGILTKYLPGSGKFDWLVLPPTNRLKQRPWWDDRVHEILELVRKEALRGTMYRLPAVLDTDLRRGMFAWATR